MTAAELFAKDLVAQGYKQTSAKYRYVARLPPGETGGEALREADRHCYEQYRQLFERWCADRYRRFYAERDGHRLTLDDETFRAFKRAGGESSF